MQAINIVVNLWINFEASLSPVLKNLDPSLFQNIFLGILAIFIPFAIVFLTDVLDSKKQRSEFEKMVLSEEVLGTKKIFWLSVVGLAVLSFFSGKDISEKEKIFAIVFSLVLILLFWNPFRKILRFSEGYKPQFEISFLKGLKLSRVFGLGNKLTMDRMVRAWTSFWSEKSAYNESEFTKVFIGHIDNAISFKRYALAVQLAQTYERNIEKRDRFSVGYEVFPKIFEWNDVLWKAEQQWLYRASFQERLQQIAFLKYLPLIKKWAFNLTKRIYSEDEHFFNWHYFRQALFPVAAKLLLYDGHGPFQLFKDFEKYTQGAEAKIDQIEGDDNKQRWWAHIVGLFSSFCPMFFENINDVPNKFDVWEHYFPGAWKIVIANSKNRVPRIFLQEFLQWAQQRIFRKNKSHYDSVLSEVTNGLFPNAHHSLFPAFLILLFSSEIKYAVQKEPSFSLINTGMSWYGERNEEQIQEMFAQQDLSQKSETIQIVLDYFGEWKFIKLYREDISDEEFSSWNEYTEEQRKEIISRVRSKKLQSALEELNSAEVVEICKESERREYQRQIYIELFRLLLERVK